MATRGGRVREAERQDAERPRLRVVASRRGGRTALIPAAIVLVLAVFAVAGLEAYLSQEGFRAARLERALRDAEQRYELLRSKSAELSAPGRLQHEAAKLGMAAAANPTFVNVATPAGDREPVQAQASFAAKRLGTGGP